MRSPLHRTFTTALAALAVGTSLIATTAATTTATAATSTSAAQRRAAPVVIVSYDEHGRFSASTTTVRPGGVVFRAGAAPEGGSLELVQLHEGYSRADLFADWPQARSGKVTAVRRMSRGADLLGGAMVFMSGDSSFAMGLRRGSYLLVDLDNRQAERFTVKGRRQAGALPRVAGSADFTSRHLDAPARLPGSGWLQQTNRTGQVQMAMLDQLDPSTTDRDVKRYFASHGTEGELATLNNWVAGFPVSPGHTFQWAYDLGAGRFVIHAFLARVGDGDDPAWHGLWDVTRLR